MTRDRVVGWVVVVVLGAVVGLLVWQALDNVTLGGVVLIVAVLAAAAWDAVKARR